MTNFNMKASIMLRNKGLTVKKIFGNSNSVETMRCVCKQYTSSLLVPPLGVRGLLYYPFQYLSQTNRVLFLCVLFCEVQNIYCMPSILV
jgi:hypothetical protein